MQLAVQAHLFQDMVGVEHSAVLANDRLRQVFARHIAPDVVQLETGCVPEPADELLARAAGDLQGLGLGPAVRPAAAGVNVHHHLHSSECSGG